MKQITINTYKFNELSDSAKEYAVNKLADININHDWWGFTYDDAENVGIKITGFDIDRGSYCTIEPISDMLTMAQRIKEEHGESWDTYKAANEYLNDYDNLVHKYSDGINTDKVHEDNIDQFDTDADDLETEFKQTLSGCYLSILRNEYEYLTSEEAIIETIEANDYDFTEDGRIF